MIAADNARRATEAVERRIAEARALPYNQADCGYCGERLSRIDSVSVWDSEESGMFCSAAPDPGTHGQRVHRAVPIVGDAS